jgi:hypothetical protein
MIKRFLPSLLIASALTAAGCAPVQTLVIGQAIGPYDPDVRRARQGTLVVYTETQPFDGDSDYPVHSAYSVLTPEGIVVKEVPNHRHYLDREPTPVTLPVGQYNVATRKGARHGPMLLVAVIQAGLTTVIDLNEEVFPVRTAQGEQWVRLPSGQIIGSKSD